MNRTCLDYNVSISLLLPFYNLFLSEITSKKIKNRANFNFKLSSTVDYILFTMLNKLRSKTNATVIFDLQSCTNCSRILTYRIVFISCQLKKYCIYHAGNNQNVFVREKVGKNSVELLVLNNK